MRLKVEGLARLKALVVGRLALGGETLGAVPPGGLGAAGGLAPLVDDAVDVVDGVLARLVGAGGVPGVSGLLGDDLLPDGDGVVGLVAVEAAFLRLVVKSIKFRRGRWRGKRVGCGARSVTW